MKNANPTGTDYGTVITDLAEGIRTDLTIQHQKAMINGIPLVKVSDFIETTISFDSIGFTKDPDRKYVLHFYKNGGWIGSVRGA